MRVLNITAFVLGIVWLSGCEKSLGSKTADELTDDEVYQVMAHAGGRDEDHDVAKANRMKDEDLAQYITRTDGLRKHIKYFCGDEGTTTVDQFYARCEKLKQQGEATAAARDADYKAHEEQQQKVDDARQAQIKKLVDMEADFDTQERQLDADYKAKIAVVAKDASIENMDRLIQQSALEKELAGKRKELEKQRGEAEKVLRVDPPTVVP